MNIQQVIVITVILSIISVKPTLSQTKSKADLVVKNANVYTMDAVRSWKQALAVKDGRLVFIGNNTNIKTWIGQKTKIVDAGGQQILPGFHDTHVHQSLNGFQVFRNRSICSSSFWR